MKAFCPVCNNPIDIDKNSQYKIFVCPNCEVSLFVSKIVKEQVKLMPFTIEDANEEYFENDIDDFEDEIEF